MPPVRNPAALSPVIAGAWRLAEWGWTARQRQAWIEGNLELGVTSFEHADLYGGCSVESLFGEALALRPSLRDRVQLVSQCGVGLVNPARPGDPLTTQAQPCVSSAAHIRTSVEQSLRALRTDHLDLLLLHWPDAQVDVDAMAETLATLRAEGKVLHFGASKLRPAQLALLHSRIALTTHQLELSPLHRDPLHDGTLDQCLDLGLRPMIWSPLAGGRLFTADDERTRNLRHTLAAMASALGVTVITLVIAWVMRHPSAPLPILGSRRITVAREAMAAQGLQLDAAAWWRICVAATGPALA